MEGRGRNIGTNKTPQDVFNICNIWSVKVVRSIKERSAEKFWTCKTLSVPQPPIKILHQLLNLFTFFVLIVLWQDNGKVSFFRCKSAWKASNNQIISQSCCWKTESAKCHGYWKASIEREAKQSKDQHSSTVRKFNARIFLTRRVGDLDITFWDFLLLSASLSSTIGSSTKHYSSCTDFERSVWKVNGKFEVVSQNSMDLESTLLSLQPVALRGEIFWDIRWSLR